MKRTLYLFLLLFSTFSFGQSDEKMPALRLGGSFYSESFWMKNGAEQDEKETNMFFRNNGFNAEIQYSLLSHQSKKSEGKKLRGSETLNLGLNGYFYSVLNQSSNSIFSLDLGIEKEFFFGLHLYGKIGLGMLNTRVSGDIYTVNADGTVTENSKVVGREMILPASLGFGWNFEGLINFPISINARTMHFSKSFGQYSTYKAGILFGLEYRFRKLNVSPIKEF